jgi:hypothetical protein
MLVDRGRATFSEWFNAVPNVAPHEFRGLPADIGITDWVFYELGGSLWDRDNGYALTCAWGNVLVQSFGFQWSVIGTPRDFRDYILHHPAGYGLFPWKRLWESVVSQGGGRFERLWVRIMTDVEMFGSFPEGWYPAIDAIRGEPLGWPSEAIQLLKERFHDRPDTFFEELGLWPYDWTDKSDWSQILSWLGLQFNKRPKRST